MDSSLCSLSRALWKSTIENRFGDAVLEDLDRAAGDHPAAAAAQAVLDQRLAGCSRWRPSPAAPRCATSKPAWLQASLGERGLLGATAGRGRRWRRRGRAAAAPASSLSFMSANFHCRPWNSHEQAAELLALQRPARARLLVGVAAERERARGVADALDVEAGDLLLEAAFAEQHHLVGHEARCRSAAPPIPRRT